jgi:cell wall-associated NlpC family hydrolase
MKCKPLPGKEIWIGVTNKTAIAYIVLNPEKRQQDVHIRLPFLYRLCLNFALTFIISLILCCTSKPASNRQHSEIRQTPKNNTQSVTGRNAGNLAAALARDQVGVPYRYGGSSPSGFDCSGLVQYVYGKLGVSLLRKSRDMVIMGHQVSIHDLLPGDLVFFRINRSRVSHVGIYIGNNEFVHATKSGHPVRKDNITKPWWQEAFVVGRRLF